MAKDSKRKIRDRRARRQLSQALRFVDMTTLQHENKRLADELAFYQKQNFYASSILKAILAQSGDQTLTKGTIDNAVHDDQHVFSVDAKPGTENEYLVRLIHKVTATDTTPAPTQTEIDAAVAKAAMNKDVTITRVPEERVGEAVV